MPTYSASIKRATSAPDLINDGEHCSADLEKLATVGRAVGHQIRVIRNSTQYSLYTVSEVRQESPEYIVQMGLVGRQRLGTPNEFSGTVDSQVPHPTYDDAEAEANSEFVERLTDDGTHNGLVACAPHGGAIEGWTDEQAEHVATALADKGVSSWRCKGWKSGGGASDRWHITSTDLHRASFPLLDSISSRGFTYAVSFHGLDEQKILIGGAAPLPLKQQIQTAIQTAVTGSGIPVEVATGGGHNGDSLDNFVNWLTAGGANGVQIEQSRAARDGYWQAIAAAVARVYECYLEALCKKGELLGSRAQAGRGHGSVELAR
ncbi:MAG: poly-gamma-glutamate hydrolase family protein [Pseudonocardiaceae bacterium]